MIALIRKIKEKSVHEISDGLLLIYNTIIQNNKVDIAKTPKLNYSPRVKINFNYL